MKLTKVFAGVAAAAVAVSSLAVSAFADVLMSKTGNTSSAEKYSIDFTGYTEEQLGTVKVIEADVTIDTDFANGTIGGNIEGTWASLAQFEVSEDTTVTWELPGSLVSYDADGNFAPYAEVQFWWVNNIPDTEDEGTVALTAVRLLDADGNEVLPEAAIGESTDTVEPGETEEPSDILPGESSGSPVSPDTGVAVTVIPAVLAAAALATTGIVLKKRSK